jgi:glucose uptake protein GlcU
MIHEWFTHFGFLAIVFFLVGLIPSKAYGKRHRSQTGEDRIEKGVGTLIMMVIAGGFLALAFLLVCFGISGTIVGWVGMLLAGVAFGMIKTGD